MTKDPLRVYKKIVEILPSYYFQTCVVIITECDHRHIRPESMNFKVGDDFACPFCEEP